MGKMLLMQIRDMLSHEARRYEIDIFVLNRVAFWALKYSLQEWNIEAKNEIKFPFRVTQVSLLVTRG